MIGPLQNLDQGALLAPAPIHTDHPRDGAVAVQQGTHLTRREEQVITPLIGDQKAETIGVTDHAPPDQVGLRHRQEGVTAIAYQLTVALHGA